MRGTSILADTSTAPDSFCLALTLQAHPFYHLGTTLFAFFSLAVPAMRLEHQTPMEENPSEATSQDTIAFHYEVYSNPNITPTS